MTISIIVAVDKNRLIGANNSLPWYLPADLAYFQKVTMSKTVIMGRKTYESIGRVLPGRKNIVISRNSDLHIPNVLVIHHLQQIFKLGKNEEVMIIGGATLYKEMLPHTQRLYMTKVDASFAGDAHFPVLNKNEWRLIFSRPQYADKKNKYNYCFEVLQRV